MDSGDCPRKIDGSGGEPSLDTEKNFRNYNTAKNFFENLL